MAGRLVTVSILSILSLTLNYPIYHIYPIYPIFLLTYLNRDILALTKSDTETDRGKYKGTIPTNPPNTPSLLLLIHPFNPPIPPVLIHPSLFLSTQPIHPPFHSFKAGRIPSPLLLFLVLVLSLHCPFSLSNHPTLSYPSFY